MTQKNVWYKRRRARTKRLLRVKGETSDEKIKPSDFCWQDLKLTFSSIQFPNPGEEISLDNGNRLIW